MRPIGFKKVYGHTPTLGVKLGVNELVTEEYPHATD